MQRRRKERQEEALERQKVSDKRTPQEQLKRLDNMFGKNKGAKKERAKLKAIISTPSKKKKSDRKNKRNS